MIGLVKRAACATGLDAKAVLHTIMASSLRGAIRENRWAELIEKQRRIVPDLRSQYSSDFPDEEYQRFWDIKLRAQHAFQTSYALEALAMLNGRNLTVVDLGDSSGHHGMYLEGLAAPNKIARAISVNFDPVAIGKIRAKGRQAIHDRVENLPSHGIKADLLVCFETLEHLTDPVRFLHAIAIKNVSDTLLVTVPYRRHSRFGGSHMRMALNEMPARLTAEQVHMYEFSPSDWTTLFRFAGWRVVSTRIFLQYPSAFLMRPIAAIWRKYDLEGFFGAILVRDTAVSDRYDW